MIGFKKKLIVAGISSLMAMPLYAGPYDDEDHRKVFAGARKYEYLQQHGTSVAGKFNEVARFISDQLAQNKDIDNISESTIAITSIVDVENMKDTNKIGVSLAEHMIHELQIRGFKVIDFKLMPAIQVGDDGDYTFSRKVEELRKKHNINYVFSGTFTKHTDGMLINARILDMESSIVTSSAQAFIPVAQVGRLLGEYQQQTKTHYVSKPIIPKVTPHMIDLQSIAN